jgi:hypothetical protein
MHMVNSIRPNWLQLPIDVGDGIDETLGRVTDEEK